MRAYWVKREGDWIRFSPTLYVRLLKSRYNYVWREEGRKVNVYFYEGLESLKANEDLEGPCPGWLRERLEDGMYYFLEPSDDHFTLVPLPLSSTSLLRAIAYYVYVRPSGDISRVYLPPSIGTRVGERIYFKVDGDVLHFSLKPVFEKGVMVERDEYGKYFYAPVGGKEGFYELVRDGDTYKVGFMILGKEAFTKEVFDMEPRDPNFWRHVAGNVKKLLGKGIGITYVADSVAEAYGLPRYHVWVLARFINEGREDELIKGIAEGKTFNYMYRKVLLGEGAGKKEVVEAVEAPLSLAEARKSVARLVEQGRYEEAERMIGKLKELEETLSRLRRLWGELKRSL